MDIIFEDNDIIVINKEHGIPCQPDKTGAVDLYTQVYQYLNGPDYLGLIHRLDRPVGGIIVFAKNEKLSAVISKQISERKVIKKYIALVCGDAKQEESLEDWLIKNQRLNISKVVDKNVKGSKLAKLKYRTLDKKNDGELLSKIEIELFTGRHHQIRVQLANADLPIYGDTKYNKSFQRVRGFVKLALCSTYFEFYNPKLKENMIFKISPDF